MIRVRCSCCFRYHLEEIFFCCFFCWVLLWLPQKNDAPHPPMAMMMTTMMAMTPSGSVKPRHRHAKEYPHSKGRRGGLWCSTSKNSSDKIPPIETVPPSQFDDMSKEELKRELAASFEIRAAMAAKLELVEDQLRATVSEVCKILALKRETEFELERMKEKYEPSRESS